MATIITHAVAGAAFGQFAPEGVSRLRIYLCLALAAVLPDADVLGFAFGIPYGHPLGHRGITHAIVFAVLAAPVVAAFALGGKAFRPGRFAGMTLIASRAVMSRGILDALTDAGLGVGFLIPFTEERYFFPWRPVMTAGLNPSTFCSDRTMTVLENEVRGVWLVIGVVSALHLSLRRLAAAANPKKIYRGP